MDLFDFDDISVAEVNSAIEDGNSTAIDNEVGRLWCVVLNGKGMERRE